MIQTHQIDVIAMQEVFHADTFSWLSRAGRKAGLRFAVCFLNGPDLPARSVGSGLLLLSRYPVVEQHFLPYRLNGDPSHLTRFDYHGGKGIGLARVATPSGNVDVYTSHLIAQYMDAPRDFYEYHRVAQCFEAAMFIRATRRSPLALFLSDMNSPPHSPCWRILTNLTSLQDAYSAFRQRPVPSLAPHALVNTMAGPGSESDKLDEDLAWVPELSVSDTVADSYSAELKTVDTSEDSGTCLTTRRSGLHGCALAGMPATTRSGHVGGRVVRYMTTHTSQGSARSGAVAGGDHGGAAARDSDSENSDAESESSLSHGSPMAPKQHTQVGPIPLTQATEFKAHLASMPSHSRSAAACHQYSGQPSSSISSNSGSGSSYSSCSRAAWWRGHDTSGVLVSAPVARAEPKGLRSPLEATFGITTNTFFAASYPRFIKPEDCDINKRLDYILFHTAPMPANVMLRTAGGSTSSAYVLWRVTDSAIIMEDKFQPSKSGAPVSSYTDHAGMYAEFQVHIVDPPAPQPSAYSDAVQRYNDTRFAREAMLPGVRHREELAAEHAEQLDTERVPGVQEGPAGVVKRALSTVQEAQPTGHRAKRAKPQQMRANWRTFLRAAMDDKQTQDISPDGLSTEPSLSESSSEEEAGAAGSAVLPRASRSGAAFLSPALNAEGKDMEAVVTPGARAGQPPSASADTHGVSVPRRRPMPRTLESMRGSGLGTMADAVMTHDRHELQRVCKSSTMSAEPSAQTQAHRTSRVMSGRSVLSHTTHTAAESTTRPTGTAPSEAETHATLEGGPPAQPKLDEELSQSAGSSVEALRSWKAGAAPEFVTMPELPAPAGDGAVDSLRPFDAMARALGACQGGTAAITAGGSALSAFAPAAAPGYLLLQDTQGTQLLSAAVADVHKAQQGAESESTGPQVPGTAPYLAAPSAGSMCGAVSAGWCYDSPLSTLGVLTVETELLPRLRAGALQSAKIRSTRLWLSFWCVVAAFMCLMFPLWVPESVMEPPGGKVCTMDATEGSIAYSFRVSMTVAMLLPWTCVLAPMVLYSLMYYVLSARKMLLTVFFGLAPAVLLSIVGAFVYSGLVGFFFAGMVGFLVLACMWVCLGYFASASQLHSFQGLLHSAATLVHAHYGYYQPQCGLPCHIEGQLIADTIAPEGDLDIGFDEALETDEEDESESASESGVKPGAQIPPATVPVEA